MDSPVQKPTQFLLRVAAISAAVIAIFNAYSFYKNNLWHPTIIVEKVDFANGIANVTINGRPFVLKGDSSYLISYDWGIRLGYTFTNDGKRKYDRIEVIKRNMVFKVVREAGEGPLELKSDFVLA